jgi:hypothetical protein
MICDNCTKEASYTCADAGVNPVNYCVDCLPVWLQNRAAAGHFPLVQTVVEEVPAPKKKKAVSSDENN